MYKVEFYAKVRMAVLQGHQSQREAARYFGIHRETVRKICENSTPPNYHRRSKPMSTKLGPFMAFIDDVLKADKLVHFKQRHTARRVFKRLQEEQGYTGGYTLVQEYMHQVATKQKEVFIPLVHAPGHAQFDFGQANGIILDSAVGRMLWCIFLAFWLGETTRQTTFCKEEQQRQKAKKVCHNMCSALTFWVDLLMLKNSISSISYRSIERSTAESRIIEGKEISFRYACFSLPHSDAFFVKAFPVEDTSAFLDSHLSAFNFFGGIPLSILYDNTKIAVAKILGDGQRKRTQAFSELQSHYLFEDRFARPARGNDKGNVEGCVGFARRNFMTPMPVFDDFDALNAYLKESCIARQGAKLRGECETIAQRLTRDCAALMVLPPPFDVSQKQTGRASSQSLVRYRNNDYSIPTQYAHQLVLIKATVDWINIYPIGKTESIACHRRSYKKEDCILNPLHYLALLERKSHALDQAAPLQNWHLPKAFERLRQTLEERMGVKGRREYIQVIRLLETFTIGQVEHAIVQAHQMGVIEVCAIKHLLLRTIQERPEILDMNAYPDIPLARVQATDVCAYLSLLSKQCEIVIGDYL